MDRRRLELLSWTVKAAVVIVVVGVSAWDVDRHVRANAQPVTREQEVAISEYKKMLGAELARRPVKVVEMLAWGAGRGDGRGGDAGPSGPSGIRSGD